MPNPTKEQDFLADYAERLNGRRPQPSTDQQEPEPHPGASEATPGQVFAEGTPHKGNVLQAPHSAQPEKPTPPENFSSENQYCINKTGDFASKLAVAEQLYRMAQAHGYAHELQTPDTLTPDTIDQWQALAVTFEDHYIELEKRSGQAGDMASAIRAITGRGWQVVPVNVTQKDRAGKLQKNAYDKWGGGSDTMPDGSEWPGRTANTDKALAWLKRWPQMGIAIATGGRSQNNQGQWLLLLDFDKPEYWNAFEAICAAKGYDLLAQTFVEKSPNGWHVCFFSRSDLAIKNGVRIPITPDCSLDVRWHGGYFITAPTVTVDGWKYEVMSDRLPGPLPEWLEVLLVKQFADHSSEARQAGQGQKGAQLPATKAQTRPAIDKGGRLTKWQQKAINGEFQKVASAPTGCRNNQLNESALKLFKIDGIDPATVESVMLEACQQNGIPQTEALRTIASARRKADSEAKRGPKDLFLRIPNGRPEGKQTLPAPLPATLPDEQIQWPELYRYDDLDRLEQFAVENHGFGLPAVLSEIVKANSVALQIPEGSALCAFLGAFAAACQGKWQVRVKPGFSVPLSLYLMAPLGPGNRKSALVTAAKRPILEYEQVLQTEAERKIQEAITRRRITEKAITELETKASKAQNSESREELTRMAIAEREALEDLPVKPVLTVDDCTPEALVVAMSTNPFGLSVIEAEGTLLDILSGQYSDGKVNITAILKAHDVEPIKQFRVKREWVTVMKPNLTLSIFPQPIVITRRKKSDDNMSEQMRGRGFDARWLYALCKSLVGYRNLKPDPVPSNIESTYNKRIKSLLEYPAKLDSEGICLPYQIELDPEAYRLWLEVSQAIEAEMRPTGVFADMQDFASKLAGHIARLAGVLHCIEHSEPERQPVRALTMQQAIRLGAWFSEHSQAAYSLMDDTAETGLPGARAILDWIMDGRKKGGMTREFTERDAWHTLRRRKIFTGRKESVFDPALAELIERGYIVQFEQKTGRGPSVISYRVNPAVMDVDIGETI